MNTASTMAMFFAEIEPVKPNMQPSSTCIFKHCQVKQCPIRPKCMCSPSSCGVPCVSSRHIFRITSQCLHPVFGASNRSAQTPRTSMYPDAATGQHSRSLQTSTHHGCGLAVQRKLLLVHSGCLGLDIFLYLGDLCTFCLDVLISPAGHG